MRLPRRLERPRILRVADLLAAERQFWRNERHLPHYRLTSAPPDYRGLPIYPIDMAPLLAMPFGGLDESGVLYNAPTREHPKSYQPTSIAQFALAHWNAYLATGGDAHRDTFLRQARWLIEHETVVAPGVAGWPIDFPVPKYGANAYWMSALTQGNVISVLVRAYKLTEDVLYLQSAQRAARSFERDILDGGVSVAIGEDGLFFEEVAVYPASHVLNGYLLALFGLYDYVAVTGDEDIGRLIEQSLRTFHTMIEEYDTSYWTRYDLLHKHPATRFYHALHISLLQALVWYSGCQHCAAVAERWAAYQRRHSTRLRYWFASRARRYYDYLRRHGRREIHANGDAINHTLVAVPVTAFPVAGGTRSVLAGVAAVMTDRWRFEYVTRTVGPDRQALTIYWFGGRLASPRYTLSAWLYVWAARRKLGSLLRHGHWYQLILPQDGVFTGAAAAIVGKRQGVRVVCMDHGTLTLPFNPAYRKERLQALQTYRRPLRWVLRLGLLGYLAALRRMARTCVRYSDHFLVAGDEVYETCVQHLGLSPRHITRYPYVVDLVRFAPLHPPARAHLRAQVGIADDAVVITMINRLAPEKGLDIAMRGIASAIARLLPDQRGHMHVIIAGDGPLRRQLDDDRRRYAIDDVCTLWGEASADDVVKLLALSDIFLYTGTRGTNYSMAVLEAMAAGCAVVATAEPRSNAQLLAEGRGIAIQAGDADAVNTALAQLIGDPARRERMGRDARAYVAQHHSDVALRRCLLRATYWPGWSSYAETHAVSEAQVAAASQQVECLSSREPSSR